MATTWEENTPDGLQKKFFQIAAYELAWRGGEAANCLVQFFKIEKNNKGEETGRLEYNPIFSKTTQGSGQLLACSKWLTANKENPDLCPIRLFKMMLSKQTTNIKTDRLFLTPKWKNEGSPWYKNCPIGKNEIGKWTRVAAERIGLDVANKKITNHSNRASAVSNLAKVGTGEEEIVKITGHSNSSSLAPYLQLDAEHHAQIVKKMRLSVVETERHTSSATSATERPQSGSSSNACYSYNNCTFIFN